MEEQGKFNLKIGVIPNGLEKYMSFTIDNNFFDSFQSLNFSLDSLVKNLNKDAFKYLSKEIAKNKLDLVKQKVFYLYEYMTNFEKFEETLPSTEIFHRFLINKKINGK